MMPDVTEKNTEAAKRSAGTAADATRSTTQAAAETAGRGAEAAAEQLGVLPSWAARRPCRDYAPLRVLIPSLTEPDSRGFPDARRV